MASCAFFAGEDWDRDEEGVSEGCLRVKRPWCTGSLDFLHGVEMLR
jgi:hypothetical protein